ncbi:hypothetical protein DFJ73DRAFT_766705 [Zopfochytrium polystomum]|nr:hypothetical protein DFJ73DRAFT_766705 [Zopfochytrium polystomum]
MIRRRPTNPPSPARNAADPDAAPGPVSDLLVSTSSASAPSSPSSPSAPPSSLSWDAPPPAPPHHHHHNVAAAAAAAHDPYSSRLPRWAVDRLAPGVVAAKGKSRLPAADAGLALPPSSRPARRRVVLYMCVAGLAFFSGAAVLSLGAAGGWFKGKDASLSDGGRAAAATGALRGVGGKASARPPATYTVQGLQTSFAFSPEWPTDPVTGDRILNVGESVFFNLSYSGIGLCDSYRRYLQCAGIPDLFPNSTTWSLDGNSTGTFTFNNRGNYYFQSFDRESCLESQGARYFTCWPVPAAGRFFDFGDTYQPPVYYVNDLVTFKSQSYSFFFASSLHDLGECIPLDVAEFSPILPESTYRLPSTPQRYYVLVNDTSVCQQSYARFIMDVIDPALPQPNEYSVQSGPSGFIFDKAYDSPPSGVTDADTFVFSDMPIGFALSTNPSTYLDCESTAIKLGSAHPGTYRYPELSAGTYYAAARDACDTYRFQLSVQTRSTSYPLKERMWPTLESPSSSPTPTPTPTPPPTESSSTETPTDTPTATSSTSTPSPTDSPVPFAINGLPDGLYSFMSSSDWPTDPYTGDHILTVGSQVFFNMPYQGISLCETYRRCLQCDGNPHVYPGPWSLEPNTTGTFSFDKRGNYHFQSFDRGACFEGARFTLRVVDAPPDPNLPAPATNSFISVQESEGDIWFNFGPSSTFNPELPVFTVNNFVTFNSSSYSLVFASSLHDYGQCIPMDVAQFSPILPQSVYQLPSTPQRYFAMVNDTEVCKNHSAKFIMDVIDTTLPQPNVFHAVGVGIGFNFDFDGYEQPPTGMTDADTIEIETSNGFALSQNEAVYYNCDLENLDLGSEHSGTYSLPELSAGTYYVVRTGIPDCNLKFPFNVQTRTTGYRPTTTVWPFLVSPTPMPTSSSSPTPTPTPTPPPTESSSTETPTDTPTATSSTSTPSPSVSPVPFAINGLPNGYFSFESLSEWPTDPYTGDHILFVGSQVLFTMPYEGINLCDSYRRCLECDGNPHVYPDGSVWSLEPNSTGTYSFKVGGNYYFQSFDRGACFEGAHFTLRVVDAPPDPIEESDGAVWFNFDPFGFNPQPPVFSVNNFVTFNSSSYSLVFASSLHDYGQCIPMDVAQFSPILPQSVYRLPSTPQRYFVMVNDTEVCLTSSAKFIMDVIDGTLPQPNVFRVSPGPYVYNFDGYARPPTRMTDADTLQIEDSYGFALTQNQTTYISCDSPHENDLGTKYGGTYSIPELTAGTYYEVRVDCADADDGATPDDDCLALPRVTNANDDADAVLKPNTDSNRLAD